MKKKLFLMLLLLLTLSLSLVACDPTDPPDPPDPEPTTVTVTLNAGEGEFADGEATLEMEIEKGGKITINPADAPTFGDFELNEWYTDAALTTRWTANTTFNADTTVYAYWATPGVDFTMESNGDGTATLVQYVGEIAEGETLDLRIPAYITNDLGAREKVTVIGGVARTEGEGIYNFLDSAIYPNVLTNLVMPKSLEQIGEWSFEKQANLKSVVIPCNVDGSAFRECTGLETVSFSGTDIVIANAVFYGNAALKSVNFTGVKSMGEWTFYGAEALTELKLADVESIGNHSFRGSKVEKVTHNGKLTYVGDAAFQEVITLTDFDFSGVETIRDWAFYGCGFEEVDLSEVENVCAYSFHNIPSLVSVIFGHGETVIGQGAFRGTGLTELDLNGVLEIGEAAFMQLALTDVDFGTVKTIGKEAFRYITTLTEIDLTGVESVGDSAFYGLPLTSIVLGGTVKTILDNAFRDTLITEINLTGVESVGSAFYGMTNLVEVTFSNSIRTIGNWAFTNTGITEINLTGVESIGEGAFQGTALTSVTLSGTLKTIGKDAFRSSNITAIDLTGVEEIKGGALCDTPLVTVVIPASVTVLGKDMFWNCTALTSVDISATGATNASEVPEGWDENWAQYCTATIVYATAA